MVKISVIIPVYNNFELTLKCINSIKKFCFNNNYEIIIVDDCSFDETKEFFISQNEIKYIRNDKNMGFAYSCNRGAEIACGEILLFLNNDTLIFDDILIKFAKSFDEYNNAGIFGAKLLYPDNTIQHGGVLILPDKKVTHLFKNFPSNYPDANKLRELQAVTGACLGIKKDLFFEVGKFDEKFINGFEDLDLCFKVKQMGYKIFYNPEITLYHFEEKTRSALKNKNEEINSKLITERWLIKVQPDFFLLDEGYNYKLNDIGEFYIYKTRFDSSLINSINLLETIKNEPLYFDGYKRLISTLLDSNKYEQAFEVGKTLINFEPIIINFKILKKIALLKQDSNLEIQLNNIIMNFENIKIKIKPTMERIYRNLMEKRNFKIAKYYKEWLDNYS